VLFSRRTKFFFIEKILLPLAILPIRLLIKTWRLRVLGVERIREVPETARVVLATYHGTLMHLVAFAPFAARYGRRFVVMTSPSYDGRLLAAFLRHFGVANVSASSRSRNFTGSAEFIRRIETGDIGVIAVDGPSGPRCVAKPGVLKIAWATGAHLLLVTSSASSGISFGTWDGAHLPAPFAKVQVNIEFLPPPKEPGGEKELSVIQEALLRSARQIHSHVLSGVQDGRA
jgi:lysophospholipid acyltransferase (LPLAT)-like uncharacterized protein